MSLEEEIVAWATGRPPWQQRALLQISSGEPRTAPAVVAGELAAGIDPLAQALIVSDLPGGGPKGGCVRLDSVIPLAHVNALVDGQCLSVAPSGITVVYGDNASGKSGFARMVKQVVNARVREEVLTDVFEDQSGAEPSATIRYQVDDASHESTWPENTDPVLRQIGFYDDASGEAYITHETTVTYRPPTLVVMDQLIDHCDAVKLELDELLNKNTLAKVPLPEVAADTEISAFLSSLSDETTSADIDGALVVPMDVDLTISRLIDEEARLRATDPTRERKRLTELAEGLGAVKAHLESLDSGLNDRAYDQLEQVRQTSVEHRAAADIASSTSFDAEPLSGVGSETWRAMWLAAARYSESEAYQEREFPAAEEGDRCVLCEQELSLEAGDRLHRFHQFMQDDTERQAASSQRVLEQLEETIRQIEPMQATIAVALAAIEMNSPDLALMCRSAIEQFTSRKDAIVTPKGDRDLALPDLPVLPIESLVELSSESASQAAAIDDAEFQRQLGELTAKRLEFEGRRSAGAARDVIDAEVARLSDRSKIEAARSQTDTSSITKKSTDLARHHVTAVILDQFTRESEGLRLRRVTLAHPGGRKGQLMQKPTLLAAKQKADVTAVLSEGEQTALGLAGFLTERHFDETKSAMVLDDPVTSLDHIRRSHVAARLCEFAADRQVTVFTHDLTFVDDIRKAAEEAGVPFTPRAIERHGDGSVGMCRDQHPWKAKDAKERLGYLETEVARIKRESPGWEATTYEREVADWAGSLSETWELIVDMDIARQLVDRGTSEVRPKMFRVLARITEEDNNEFQESYGRCSKWLRRHRKAPEVNPVPPEISELQAELKLVRDWHNRVKNYSKP
jgi:energy-coupling factor transporter ATP-binding protein EcfA2